MPQADWISAEDARDRLGVRAQTLYAYVSRGRVQVRPDPGDSRRSLYRAADIAALTERKSRSRKISEVAAGAINWGEPVLASAITTVAGGRLFYRGRDAIRLAETETLESVARLLRGGHGAALKRTERPPPPAADDMRSRGARVLLAAPEGTPGAELPLALADHEDLDPIVAIQSFYQMVESLSRARGRNPDKPMHLSKVTLTQ